MVDSAESFPEVLLEPAKRLLMLSRATEQCSCCCVHEQKHFDALSPWRLGRCFLNSDTKEDYPIPKCNTNDILPKGNLKTKKKNANISSVYSKSFPSLANNDAFQVRGTDICSLDPSEQAAYYRLHMQIGTRKKLTCDCPHNSRRNLQQRQCHALMSPQIASQSQGLRILPMKSRKHSTSNSNKLLLTVEQTIKRPPGAGVLWLRQTRACAGERPANSFLDSEFKCRWPRSLQSYRITPLQHATHSRDMVVKGTQRQTQQGHKTTQSYCNNRRGSEYLDLEEDACASSHCLHRSCNWSDTSAPLQCFPLGITAQHRARGKGGTKNASAKQKSLKTSKNSCAGWKLVPPLPINNNGVVFRRGQPSNLLLNQSSSSLNPGLQGGFRYETLYNRRRRGTDSALALPGPRISPPS